METDTGFGLPGVDLPRKVFFPDGFGELVILTNYQPDCLEKTPSVEARTEQATERGEKV